MFIQNLTCHQLYKAAVEIVRDNDFDGERLLAKLNDQEQEHQAM